MKYIFVTGGVVSGLGKGICAASLGRLLKQRGLRVRNQKFDPYLNVDPGTMSPYQHGEVFVTDDGAETDLDLGHYERFVDESLDGNASVSSGKVFWNVLEPGAAGRLSGRHGPDHPPYHQTRSKTASTPWQRDDVDVVIIGNRRDRAAILRASPFWRPSARWPARWGGRMWCLSMCRWWSRSQAPGS